MPFRLIVNADDFGFTRDVNEGIIEAHRHGILTATTLMANGDAFDDAVALARQTPSLDVGSDWRVLAFTSIVAAVAVTIFGLAPAWRATRSDPRDALRGV